VLAEYSGPLPPPILSSGYIVPIVAYTWLVKIIGTFALPHLSVKTRNAPLTSCALVMSRFSAPDAMSVISLVVESCPKESSTSIMGLRSSSGTSRYLSIIRHASVLNSSMVATGKIIIRRESMPRSSIISLEMADSDSK